MKIEVCNFYTFMNKNKQKFGEKNESKKLKKEIKKH